MNRYFSYAASSLGLALLTACSLLIPPGIPSGMANPSVRSSRSEDYPEHFVYRIDDHRYITIQGNDHCDGMIYYNDTRLGIRTEVSTTGITLGGGTFDGYYAINSEYVAIPALIFSQVRGVLLYIYYSHDGGRTFNRVLVGAEGGTTDVLILDGKTLYFASVDDEASSSLRWAYVYDVSRDIATQEGQQEAIGPDDGDYVDTRLVSLKLKSPSGVSRWTCGPPMSATANHEVAPK